MTLSIDVVTIDYTDPQSLLGFWTAALGLWWTIMTDPEGSEFCVGSHHG